MVYKGLWSLYAIGITVVGGLIGFFAGEAFLGLPFAQRVELQDTPQFLVKVGFALAGVLAGFLLSLVSFGRLREVLSSLERVPLLEKVVVAAAVIIGLSMGLLVTLPFTTTLTPRIGLPLQLLACLLGVIFTVAVGRSALTQLRRIFPRLEEAEDEALPRSRECPKFLDTNVIIDGRIADICKTRFLEGTLYVPSFVLAELQAIADSADNLRRARGRRGLEILNRMRKELDQAVEIYEDTSPAEANDVGVDIRLVKLAREKRGAVVTNDYNLNKVAELHEVPVLNVNELANAVKPVFLPGEELTVTPVKEGSQPRQGVAYLDDGTMVVVQEAAHRLGEMVPVVVTSTIQTVAGKMIFAEPVDGSSKGRK
jgi:uncharacterized protein YacL